MKYSRSFVTDVPYQSAVKLVHTGQSAQASLQVQTESVVHREVFGLRFQHAELNRQFLFIVNNAEGSKRIETCEDIKTAPLYNVMSVQTARLKDQPDYTSS